MTTDDKLRHDFHELRSADAQHVPAFRRVARAPVPAAAFPWWQVAVSAVLVVALIVVVQIKHRPVADPQQWAALSNWRATTDELLTVSSTPWGSTLRTPTDSWIESSTQTKQKETL